MLRDTAREEGVGVQYFSFTVYFHSFFFLRVLFLSAGGRIEMLFLIFFSTPSSCGHSPYFIYNEQRESVDILMCFLCCGYLFNPSVSSWHLSYILRCKTQRRRVILSYISCLFFSLAVSRSITGCCVSHIEKVARSDGGVEYLQKSIRLLFYRLPRSS